MVLCDHIPPHDCINTPKILRVCDIPLHVQVTPEAAEACLPTPFERKKFQKQSHQKQNARGASCSTSWGCRGIKHVLFDRS